MAWHQGGFSKLQVLLTSSAGEKKITYNSGTGINGHTGNNVDIYLGTTGSTSWRRFERNIEADYELYAGGATWTITDGLIIIPDATYGSYDMNVDDIRLSDSVTVEHNTLGPGVIGHILRNTTWDDTSSLAREDKWFHYDQVGSVLSVSDGDGDLAVTHQQDAFGNVIGSWSGGEWGAHDSWQFQTKNVFKDNLLYFANRILSTEISTFSSRDKFAPELEESYAFGRSNPAMNIDPDGLTVKSCAYARPLTAGTGICNVYCRGETYNGFDAQCVCENAGNSPWDKRVRACLACAHKGGMAIRDAHDMCYAAADKEFLRLSLHGGYESRLDVGARLGWKCLLSPHGKRAVSNAVAEFRSWLPHHAYPY